MRVIYSNLINWSTNIYCTKNELNFLKHETYKNFTFLPSFVTPLKLVQIVVSIFIDEKCKISSNDKFDITD